MNSSRDVKLVIASQPTRGLDVGSIEYIHKEIVIMRDRGVGVLLISAELDEIMSLSDRIAVMYRGQIVVVVDARQADRDNWDCGWLAHTLRLFEAINFLKTKSRVNRSLFKMGFSLIGINGGMLFLIALKFKYQFERRISMRKIVLFWQS